MKTTGKRSHKLTAILFILIVFLGSCATKFVFETSAIVPAAEGFVKVKKDRNGNYGIDLRVKRLAKPERLSPPAEVYIVWLVPSLNAAQNIGRLQTSTKGFSRSLQSSLSTVTSFKPASFFITAEDRPDVHYPGSRIILRTAQ